MTSRLRGASIQGESFRPGEEPELAPEVYGLLFDEPEGIYISAIYSLDPGRGNVGRFIDGLPRDRRVVFSTVVNRKLAGMLRRRGFRHQTLTEEGVTFEAMVREAKSADRCGVGCYHEADVHDCSICEPHIGFECHPICDKCRDQDYVVCVCHTALPDLRERFAAGHADQWRGCVACGYSHHQSAFCSCGRCFLREEANIENTEVSTIVHCECGKVNLWD